MTYDHLTDHELIRTAINQTGIIRALAERLELLHERNSVFGEVRLLMDTLGETTTVRNDKQAERYLNSMSEDINTPAGLALHVANAVSYGMSMGWDVEKEWDKLMVDAVNFAIEATPQQLSLF